MTLDDDVLMLPLMRWCPIKLKPMSRVDASRLTPRITRKYSQMTIDTRFTYSSYDDRDSPERARRKVSFDSRNNQQRLMGEEEPWQERAAVKNKGNFRLSTEVLSFEMEEQRNHQLRIIHGNPQLLAYYNCLKKLFMILYQASIPINENKFNINPETLLGNNNLQVLSVLFDESTNEWSLHYAERLRTFGNNMTILSTSSQEFERRIELVAIKSCLHNEKKPKIQKAFLNTKIEAYWRRIEGKFGDLEAFAYIEDQFQKAEEKLCFIEIQEFVKAKLSTEQFGHLLRKYCQLQEIDHDMNLSFKFEFFMAEELCFHSLNDLFKEDKPEPSGICEIM